MPSFTHYTMMSDPNNEQAPRGPVRVGLIADGPELRVLAAAIDACVLIQPLGQAGMAAAAAAAGIPRQDDPRVLLAQPDLEAVVLGPSTRGDVDWAAMAAEHGLHVWRLPPLAASFAEATEVVSRARQLPTIQRVASWWEYVADHVWDDLQWPAGFDPSFSDLRAGVAATSSESDAGTLGRQTGNTLTGGGYALLEALVAVRGLPESVAGMTGNCRGPSAGAESGAEDVAVAVLRYGGGGCAVLRATRGLPPIERQLTHHAAQATVTMTDQEVWLTAADGQEIDRRPLPGDFLASELLLFAELVRSAGRDRAIAPFERHLAASALVEAIRLSARTGQPESPRKFYEVQGWPGPRP